MCVVFCAVIDSHPLICCFFFNDTATTEIYTLSLHDALPISHTCIDTHTHAHRNMMALMTLRSEEHTSELQSHLNLVCRLLLAKKKTHSQPNVEHRAHRRLAPAISTRLCG